MMSGVPGSNLQQGLNVGFLEANYDDVQGTTSLSVLDSVHLLQVCIPPEHQSTHQVLSTAKESFIEPGLIVSMAF